MGLRFFNTLSRSVQEFVPLNADAKTVGMYCCGPTVYDFAHIGNWRTFVFADLVRRYLEFRGFKVKHVMNITDVEDKIIRRVRETRTTLRDFTSQYETAFFDDLKALGCLEPHVKPRATEHIDDIITLIEKLIARGIAYKANDGSVYFSIEKYRGCGCHYGQLQKLNFDEMRIGERVAADEYDKESVADFALWKAYVPDDGEVTWDSPWGKGRPGWHIECSAMSMKVLGESFDLHLGGEDLKFPHHEDEIAQSEGATGKPFVKYWLHGAHLLVEGKKMSKSLGNFFTLRDLMTKGFTGREVRYLLLTAHYRETFNFTMEGLLGAQSALRRIEECLNKMLEILSDAQGSYKTQLDTNLLKQFADALDDDLNVSKAWGVIFGWIRDLNRAIAQKQLSAKDALAALGTWKKVNEVLGIDLKPSIPTTISDETAYYQGIGADVSLSSSIKGPQIPDDVQLLSEQRLAAKKAKNYKLADELRERIKSHGYVVVDTPEGAKLKKL